MMRNLSHSNQETKKVNKGYFKSLGRVLMWLGESEDEYSGRKARGAIVILKSDYIPPINFVLHTVRVPGGPKGDRIGKAGEEVSIWIPNTWDSLCID
jgi:hypothetical protein